MPLAIWLYLLLFHRGFWRLRERDTLPVTEPAHWPSVVAVVPARDEADVIQRSIGSLIAQDYPAISASCWSMTSPTDGTGDLARALSSKRLTVLTGAARPPGWTGKLWAMQQGSDHAAQLRARFPVVHRRRHRPHPRQSCASWWRAPAATRCWCR